MLSFMFPASLETMLLEHTYASPDNIANTMRNSLVTGEPWVIRSRKPGNAHYRVWA